jgi:hypothetical protein
MKQWIPAFAEEHHSHCREILVRSTPQKHSSPYTERLRGIEKKYSGGRTELCQRDGECTTLNY